MCIIVSFHGRGDVVLCKSVQDPLELVCKRITKMEGDQMGEVSNSPSCMRHHGNELVSLIFPVTLVSVAGFI